MYYCSVYREEELWQSLENETDRAYEAFQTFLSLPSGDRTLVAAYRSYVHNPDSSKVSDTWSEWARRYAWKERAGAYDAHIDRIRRNSMEEAIQQEAAEQACQAERARNHLNEILTIAYTKSMDFMEELDTSSMRFSDTIQVARLHMEAIEKLASAEEGVRVVDWTEEDDAELDEILKRMRKEKDFDAGSDEDSESDHSVEGE